jgi:hypothetical protein
MAAQQQQQRSSSKAGSVQASFMDLREVKQDVLCLAAPGHPETRTHVAVLKTDGINYFLKSDGEQELIDDLYGHMLTGLSHDLEILIRVLPMNLSADLAFLTPESPPEVQAGLPLPGAEEQRSPDVWAELATSQADFLQRLSSRRTLLERHFYLVVPADSAHPSGPGPNRSILSMLVSGATGSAAQRSAQQEFERARQQLDLRVSELQRQLANMGVYPERLHNNDLVRLDYSCATTLRSLSQPLHDDLIAAVSHPLGILPPTSQRLTRRSPLSYGNGMGEVDERELLRGSAARKPGRGKKGPLPDEERIDLSQLADLVAPASIRLEADYLVVEGEYVKTLVVRQLPRYVSLAWLKPLLELDEPMTICIHIRPRNSGAMIRQLRRRQLEYASSAQLAFGQGKLIDPEMQVAHGDVADLIAKLASGEERMLDFALQVQLRGRSKRELKEREERVASVLHNMLLFVRPASYEQDKALRSAMPHARNELGGGMLLPAGAVKHAFVFHSNTLFMERGIIEGITPAGEPVKLDWWAPQQRNANRIVVAPSGAGKSYKTKLDLMRMFLLYAKGMRRGGPMTFQAIVIDPEREYLPLCEELGGQWIRLAPGSAQHINPLDLPRPQAYSAGGFGETQHGDRLVDHIQTVQVGMDIALSDRGPHGAGTLGNSQKGLLDQALSLAYREAGITSDPATHSRPAPTLVDVYRQLASGACGPDPTGLTQRLHRYVYGSLRGLFDSQTNIDLNNPVVVFDIHDLDSDELRAIGFFLISNYVWTASFGSSIPRQLVVDEMLSLYQYPEGARFLETLFARSRKHYLGVTGITQHPGILANSAIPSNCAVKILMAQEAASLGLVADVFHLTPREVQVLKTCGKGDALLLTGEKRIFVHFEASEREHRLATTDPRQLAALREARQHAVSPLATSLSAGGSPEQSQSRNVLVPLAVSAGARPFQTSNGSAQHYPEEGRR